MVEARYQLFSLFTMNRPTNDFVRNEFVRADDLLSRAGQDCQNVQVALEALKARFRMDLPPIRRGKAGEPGFDEVVSLTHNPLTLRREFEAAGFSDVRVLFYHYHALPPMLASGFLELFLRESLSMEQAEDWRYFMASAFLPAGRKV